MEGDEEQDRLHELGDRPRVCARHERLPAAKRPGRFARIAKNDEPPAWADATTAVARTRAGPYFDVVLGDAPRLARQENVEPVQALQLRGRAGQP